MLSDRGDLRPRKLQHLRAQITELAISEHQHVVIRLRMSLRQYLECRRQRFDENRFFIAYVLRNQVKIFARHSDVISEGAIRVEDSHHFSIWTMTIEASAAGSTFAAPEIDLADDPFANQLVRSLFHRTDKLVARYARETHVAGKNLQIGGADTGEMNFDQT